MMMLHSGNCDTGEPSAISSFQQYLLLFYRAAGYGETQKEREKR